MLVEFLKTIHASPNGITINLYKEGEKHDIPKDLFDALRKEGWVRETTTMSKSMNEAPMNKMMQTPMNKTVETMSNKTRRTKKSRK